MGCDIHICLERRLPDTEWVGLWCSDDLPMNGRPFVARRNYGLFAEVAQVRDRSETGTYPRNLPRDVSRLSWLRYMQAPTDHHHPSHMTLDEFTDAFFRACPDNPDVRRAHAAHDLFGVDSDWPENAEYRVVFWFDN